MTIASLGRSFVTDAQKDQKVKELKQSFISLQEQEGVQLEEGLVKGKQYTYQQADEEVLIPGREGRFIKPARVINQHLVKNMVADQQKEEEDFRL